MKYLALLLAVAASSAHAVTFDELAAEAARQNAVCGSPKADDVSSPQHLDCIVETHRLSDMQQAYSIGRTRPDTTEVNDTPAPKPAQQFEDCVLGGHAADACRKRYY